MVAVKRVVDFNVRVRVKFDGTGVDTANVKMSMNPFDEIALEEAVRLKEAGIASDVLAVSIGPSSCQETLRTALAMGADRAVFVETAADLEPLALAKILRSVVVRETPRLVFLGKQAIDDDCNQTGQMLAGLMNWPQATCASKVVVQSDRVEVTREIDGGLETLSLELPAVITADLRLNQPRYLTLPNIMRAKRKPIQVRTLADCGVDAAPRVLTLSLREPVTCRAGVRVASAEELIRKLKNDAKVI